MSLQGIPYRLRALLLGTCCMMPLAGCTADARDARAEDGDVSLQPLAEREARHFDYYLQYRAVFDRPRRPFSDALQDDPELSRAAVHYLSGEAGTCAVRNTAGD